MSLTLLVAQEKWQEFDDAWKELMLAEAPVDEVLSALRLASEKKRLPRCIPMVREHADLLGAAGRPADAARLLGLALQGGASTGELGAPFFANAEKAWSSAPWWQCYSEIAGLKPDAHDARHAWQIFERLTSFEVGKLLFHPGGWGAAEVSEISYAEREVHVRFQSGRRDRFPMGAAVEIFEPLSEEDLRALHFRDPAAMRKRLKDDPLAVLKAIVARHNGRASTVAIKNALLQVGVEGSAWSGWWRKARKLAEGSEWFKVTGSAAKGEIQLLHAASNPVEDLRRQLEHSGSLADLAARVRDHLACRKDDERMRAMMLELISKRAADSREPAAVRMSAWLLLREELGEMPAALLEHLRKAVEAPAPSDPTKPPALWALFHTLTAARDQERCVSCLQAVYGDAWVDEALRNLQHAPPGMVRVVVDAVFAAGKKSELASQYRELLARPLRAPDLLVALARLAESGKLTGDFPPPVQRAQALLSLATFLFINRRGDPSLARTQTRLVELLTKGKDGVLRRLLAQASPEDLQGLQRMLQRGVDESIDSLFTEIAMRSLPASSRAERTRFWEGDRIWTTRAGLERRRAELRVLREVKIPANQEAIGRAAAMGDLSENAEWEMAIEEQRTLTSRAAEIEAELRGTELIENAILPEDMVCPGSLVRYRESASRTEHEIAILGPWDTNQDDHVVSYRAPLAAGLLGRRPGDRAKILLPSGSLDVEILTAKPVHLES
jgi:transcription elongation factor GreA